REHPEAAHVVDVEMDGTEGEAELREPVGDGTNVGIAAVSPATLVIAESPARRERRASRELAVAVDEVRHSSDDQIPAQHAAGETHRGRSRLARLGGLTELERGARRVLVEAEHVTVLVGGK